MLCFWLFERRKLKSCTKTNAEMNATGVVYTARSVWRGLTTCPHAHLLGRIVYFTGVGIQALFVLSGRLPTAEIAERAGEDTPLFVCC